MGAGKGPKLLSRSSGLGGQRESGIRRPPIPWSVPAPQPGWGRVALTTLFLTISAPGFPDVRGQVVCGIPPDEAVAFVYPTRSGDWEYVGMAGATMHQSHPSVDAALDEHAPEQAEYVCDVEVRDTPIRMVPARLYRLHRKFIAYGTVDEVTGDVLRGEYDPRQVIVGVAATSTAEGPAEGAPGADADLSYCITETRRERPPDMLSGVEYLERRLENSCSRPAFLRHCAGPYWIFVYPDDSSSRTERPASCQDYFLEPGDDAVVSRFWRTAAGFLDWDYRWAACAGDPNREPREHPCYFEP